jgi:predicted TPR repeat methyltransferase
MTDAKTIATYNAKAGEYAALVASDQPDSTLQSFINQMPAGAHVLDLGCGPGTASMHMKKAGLRPDPVDASTGMIAIAKEKIQLNARLATFHDITGKDLYDGIWANFSLLHAAPEDLPHHFQALATATKPGGILHVGMKTGEGIARDAVNRLYTYVTVDALTALFTVAGFDLIHVKEGREAGLAGTIDPFVIMRGKKT